MSRQHQPAGPDSHRGPQGPRLGAPRRARLSAVVGFCLFAACSATSSYDVLSFLFDGVPPPESSEVTPLGPPAPPELLAEPVVEGPPPPARNSVHRPYAEGRCDKCHASREGKPADISSIFQGVPMLLKPVEKLCLQCHTIEAKKFLHAPAISGQCIFCHEPHRSPTHHMLLMPTTRELCVRCHRGATFLTEEAHAKYGERECVECHDPHAADHEFNLLPGAREGTPEPRQPTVSRPRPGEW